MDRPEAPPPHAIGRYTVVSTLGDGGMGVVYLARDPSLDRLVAIKLMRSGVQAAGFHERFAREARAVASLRHPCIVTLFEFGEHLGRPFIVMEYIAGQTVAQLIAARQPMPLASRLRLAEELCRGLHHAHKAGIVHRDIKPANLILDDDGALKILDFGIAKYGDGAMTQSSALVGTPKYMSPEQIQGAGVTPQSDVFSVGLVVYELLAGRAAYEYDSVFAVMQAILHGAPTPLPVLVPGIDPRLVAVVEKALEKDPAARYQDLARMGRDLRRLRLEMSPDESVVGVGAVSDHPDPRPALTPPPTPAVPIDERRARFHRAMDANDYAGAQIACEEMLALDPESTWGLDGLELARVALLARAAPAHEVARPPTEIEPPAVVAAAPALEVQPGPPPAIAPDTPVALGRELFVERAFVDQHGRYNTVGVTVSVTTHAVVLVLAAGVALATQRNLPALADPMPLFVAVPPPAPPPVPPPAPPAVKPPVAAASETAVALPAEPTPTVPTENTPPDVSDPEPQVPVEVSAAIDTTAPPAPPPPPSGIDETPVTDWDRPAVVVKRVFPKVPAGASGVVRVAITVRSDGTVARARLLTETPFAESVLAAAEQYQFRPAQRRGRQVPVEVVVEFKLSTLK